LRLALNHQTAKLKRWMYQYVVELRLALNHQTAKLRSRIRLCFHSLFLYWEWTKTAGN
jgi:hypothetical protein